MTTQAPHVDARLSALETRVESIAGSLGEVVTAVRGLGEKIDLRGRTPWGMIWTALGTLVGVLTVVGGLAYYPIKDSQTDLKQALLLMQDRADKRIEALSGSLVSRAEHEVHWRSQDRDYDFQRDRIARAEDRVSRVEDRMTRRIERLEAERFKPGG